MRQDNKKSVSLKEADKHNVGFSPFIIAALVILIDQISKSLVRAYLTNGRPINIIPGFFDLDLSFNPGAAFGILPGFAPLFMLITLVLIYAIVKLKKASNMNRVMIWGVGLLVGGAVGNLADRFFSAQKEVTDFLSFHISISNNTYAWPNFNLADVAIVVGVALVIIQVNILQNRSHQEA